MIYCAEITKELERSKFEKTSRLKLMLIRFHLFLCKDCRCYQKDSNALDSIIKSYKPIEIEKLSTEELELMKKKIIG